MVVLSLLLRCACKAEVGVIVLKKKGRLMALKGGPEYSLNGPRMMAAMGDTKTAAKTIEKDGLKK